MKVIDKRADEFVELVKKPHFDEAALRYIKMAFITGFAMARELAATAVKDEKLASVINKIGNSEA